MRVPFITVFNYRCAVTQGEFTLAYELSPALCCLPRSVTEGMMLSRSSGHRQIMGSWGSVSGGVGGRVLRTLRCCVCSEHSMDFSLYS